MHKIISRTMFQERMTKGHHLFAINIGNGTNGAEF